MRKFNIKKAHITLRKTQLIFIAAALIAVAFIAGFFSGRLGGGTELKRETQPSINSSATQPPTSAASSPTASPISNAKKININTAGLDELKKLPDIGDALAGRIISYRDAHGRFKDIEEIMNVSGIGEKTFDKICDLITIG